MRQRRDTSHMSHDQPARVLLADGDAPVRRALALLLQTALGLQIIGEVSDLTGLAAPGAAQADLLLIDWQTLRPDPAQPLARFRALNPRLRIIAISTNPEDRAAALAAGANAFISKVDAPEQVLATVRAVLAGR